MIAHLLNQTGYLKAPAEKDRYGQPTFGDSVTVKCRFEKTNGTIINMKGETEPIDALAFLKNTETVATGYQFTFGSEKYRVMRVENIVDGRGVTRHLELKLQLWLAGT